MDLPRITIVTPSFNQRAYIGDTVRSVLLQRYPDLEYMVLDGGSTDGTLQVLEAYADRLAYFVSEPDEGQADAVAKGLQRSTGEVMAYLNSDDMLAPGALRFVGEFFATHPEVDAIYSHRCTVDEKSNVIGFWVLPPHWSYLMRRWDLIPQETCFWRRRLFEKFGNIDRSFHFALDYDLFLRYMAEGRFVRVNRFLGAFRYHANAKTSQLLQEVGFPEIERTRRKNGLRILRGESMLGGLFSLLVQREGFRHAKLRRHLAGSLPGLGWNYDQLWGGLLSDSRLPAAQAGGTLKIAESSAECTVEADA